MKSIKKTLIILATLTTILIFSISCGAIGVQKSEDVGERELGVESTVGEMEESIEGETFKIGDTVSKGELSITLNLARWEKRDALRVLQEGERQLVLDCTLKNESEESITISPLLMFKLYNAENKSCSMMKFSPNLKGSLEGSLDGGKEKRGELAFSVTTTQWKLVFESNLLDFDKAIFIINEDEVNEY